LREENEKSDKNVFRKWFHGGVQICAHHEKGVIIEGTKEKVEYHRGE
jgi:hypothetical protein